MWTSDLMASLPKVSKLFRRCHSCPWESCLSSACSRPSVLPLTLSQTQHPLSCSLALQACGLRATALVILHAWITHSTCAYNSLSLSVQATFPKLSSQRPSLVALLDVQPCISLPPTPVFSPSAALFFTGLPELGVIQHLQMSQSFHLSLEPGALPCSVPSCA